MLKQTLRITAFSVLMIGLTGLAYPLAITGVAQTLLSSQADGSLVMRDHTIIGSNLIAQNFSNERYFHSRPSAVDYAGDNSGASNLSVTSKNLIDTVAERAKAQASQNGEGDIPADMVMASGSGLDPHISPESALYQAPRIAAARHMDVVEIQALINRMTENPSLGFLGMKRVNVLAINLELDKISDE
jgi:K+-transporting ATPase ATPase C chain